MTSAGELRPGLYRLTRDVENPRGDNRVRHDFWRAPVWKEGWAVVVEPLEPGSPHLTVRRAGRLTGLIAVAWGNRDVLDALCPALAPHPKESLEDALLWAYEVDGVGPRAILERLVKEGKVAVGDIRR